MALHYSLEFSNSDSKISRSLLQYYKGQPSLDNNENVVDFDVDNITDPLKYQTKRNVEMAVRLKYYRNI